MSYVPVDQELNAQGPTGQTTNQPSAGGGGSTPPPQAGGSAGAGTAAGPSQGSPNQFGSSASKLGDYLTANAPQIQGEANTLSSNLNNQYGQVSGDIGKATDQFNQSVAGGYQAPNSALVDQAAANPTGFAATPSNVSGFQGQYNDQYTGPTSFEASSPYSAIQNEVGQAVQNTGLLNSPGGLANYFGSTSPHSTVASNTLDAALLNGNQPAQQQVKTAANQFGNLTGQLGTATTAADQGVTAAQQAAQNARNYAQSTFNPVATQFQTGLNNNLATENAARTAYNQNITGNQQQAQTENAALQNIIAQTPGLFNMTPEEIQAASNGNSALATDYQNFNQAPTLVQGLSPYLTGQPITQPGTLANTANQTQYAEDAALAQLLGSNYNPSLNQADIGQAGSYTVPTNPGALSTSAQDWINNYPALEAQYAKDIAALHP